MAISVLKVAGATVDNATSAAASFTGDVTAGNTVILVMMTFESSLASPTVTDNKGNTYALAQASTRNASEVTRIYYKTNVSSSPGTFTVTAASLVSSSYAVLGIIEVSGLVTASVVDVTGSATAGAVATHTVTTSGATSQANELVVAGVSVNNGNNNVITASPASYTRVYLENSGAHNVGEAVCRVISATGTQSASWTVATGGLSGSSSAIATFKEDSGGGTIGSGAGSASGAGTASGSGASRAAATAVASGTGAATGSGAATFSASGSASGTGTASGTGAAVTAAAASASGSSNASASGDALASGSGGGIASGTSTAVAVGASIAAAIGQASGVSNAVAMAPGGRVQPDGDAGSARQFKTKRRKVEDDPRNAMQRLVGRFMEARAPEIPPEPVKPARAAPKPSAVVNEIASEPAEDLKAKAEAEEAERLQHELEEDEEAAIMLILAA